MKTLWIGLALTLFCGCAATPRIESYAVEPVAPRDGQRVAVDQAVIMIDASSSMNQADKFPLAKSLAETLVDAMPHGNYSAGLVAYGGKRDVIHPPITFDRNRMETWIENTYLIGGVSPLNEQFKTVNDMLTGDRRTALIVFSDGRPVNVNDVLEAYYALLESSETVCVHFVQCGYASGGRPLLEELAALSPCGSYRHASSLDSAEAMRAFANEAFLR